MEVEPPANRDRRKPRGVFSLVGLLILAGICVRLLVPETVGEQVRRTVELELAGKYPDCQVRIGSGKYDPNKGLVLTDIEIRDRLLDRSSLPIIHINRMLVETRLELAAIKRGDMVLLPDKLSIFGATLNIWRYKTGKWSFEKLIPSTKDGKASPAILAKGVRVRLCKSPITGQPAIELNETELSLVSLETPAGQLVHRAKAKGTGGFLDAFVVQVEMRPDKTVDIAGEMTGLSLDNRICRRLPDCFQSIVANLSSSSVVADVKWRVDGPMESMNERWEAFVHLKSGRLVHPHLPLAFENCSAKLTLSPKQIQIHSIVGFLDDAECKARGTVFGLQWPCAMELDVIATSLNINSSLMSILPPQLRDVNDKIRPRGLVDFHGQLKCDGEQWDCDASILCKSLDVNIDRFPYPLESVQGVINYKNKITRTENLQCRLGDSTITCNFVISPPNSEIPQWITLKTDKPFPIDETLISALTPRGEPTSEIENFVRSLAPGGSVRLLSAAFNRGKSGQSSKEIDLEIIDGRLRYSGFTYPLYDVRGRVWIDDRGVQLSRFQGQNNSGGQIQCEGNWIQRNDRKGGDLDLTFRAYGIYLDDGLRAALPAAARQTWDTLSPAGTLESLEVQIRQDAALRSPYLTIKAEQSRNPSSARKELSVTPTALPYRLNIARGLIRMEGDTITISELDGYHGSSRLAAEGKCIKRPDDRWQLDLNVLTGSRIRPDTEFVSALPDEIRGSFAKLQLREPVSLRGTTNLILPDPANPQPVFSWNMLLQLEGNRIGDAGPVHDIRGEIAIRGTASGDQTTADGSVRIDSMNVASLQLTNIQGPFVIRESALQLGIPAEQVESVPAKIRGKLFEGDISLLGQVELSSGEFDVDLTLERANVAALLSEIDQNHASLKGLFGGKVKLEGILGAANLLRGSGKAALTQASLYQLPVMIQFFNQLRLKPAEDVAFTDGTANFNVDGDLISVTDLNLWGDIVAIHGGGTINGRRELNLALNTRVSPQNAWSRLVRPISNSRYTLWAINVTGTLSQPKLEGRTLEAVGETLERLFPVIDRRSADLPLATGEQMDEMEGDRRVAGPKTGGSPWPR